MWMKQNLDARRLSDRIFLSVPLLFHVILLLSCNVRIGAFGFTANDGGARSKMIKSMQGSFGRTCSLFAVSKTDAIAVSQDNTKPADLTTPSEKGVAMYVHIPYCRRRCHYCDFAIVPIGKSTVTEQPINQDNTQGDSGFQRMDEAYRNAVMDEINLIHTTSGSIGRMPLRSIYFGGGTPSLAPLETLRSIVSSILGGDDGSSDASSCFYPMANMEITIEMDPGTFDVKKLQGLKDAGFNRISLGVQSFDDTILESIGRVHRRRDIFESIQMMEQVFGRDGVNYSLDLISGLPGLTPTKWIETLETAMKLVPQPNHLSIYDLQVEQGTVFGKWYGKKQRNHDDTETGTESILSRVEERTRATPDVSSQTDKERHQRLPLPPGEDCAFMYKYAAGYLRSKGYEHYEISSYARREESGSRRSQHNQIYWEIDSEWYSVGLDATSRVKGHRHYRPRAMSDYIKWIRGQKESMLAAKESGTSWVPDWLPPIRVTDNDHDVVDDDYLADVIMTRLRTCEGLDLDWVSNVFGEDREKAILHGSELGLELGIAKHDKSNGSNSLRLVDPDGFLFSNSIISSIFLELGELGE